jgi:hypothetical protein
MEDGGGIQLGNGLSDVAYRGVTVSRNATPADSSSWPRVGWRLLLAVGVIDAGKATGATLAAYPTPYLGWRQYVTNDGA